MINYLKHSAINKVKWDNCIAKSFNGIVYAYSWYLDLVHDDWCALVENDYERVMPLTLKTKYGITYYYQPFFTQQFGVFSTGSLNPDVVENFINKIPKHVKLIDINFNSFNRIEITKNKIILNTNYLLDLIPNYNKLLSKYSTNTKRNIKKAGKNNLTFMKGVKPEILIKLFRENKGVEIGKWDDSNYVVIQRIMYTAIHKGWGFTCGIYTAYNDLCAAAFFISNSNRLIFLFSGSNKIARANGAMSMLIDTIIKANATTPQILDFEGSNNENMARFYKSFGAKKTTYPRLKINRLSFITKIIMKIIHKSQ